MTLFVFGNNAQGNLAAGISSVATTLTLSPGEGSLFPTVGAGQQFAITLIPASTNIPTEIAYCTAKSGDTLTIVRGQEGTTPTAFLAGDIVAHQLTAGQMQAFDQGGASYGRQVFSTPSVSTFTVPSPTLTVIGTAAGGGSPHSFDTSAYPCGGAGGTFILFLAGLTVGSTITVTVGQHGAAGTIATGAGTGGTTSFGSLASATGGQGGGALATYEGGLGGVATGGDVNAHGGDGSGGDGNPFTVGMGIGGASYWGGGGRMGSGSALPGRAPGSGAGGPTSVSGLDGAPGADGIVVVTWPI
jgi:hypothetical protein